jgi:hypothetical protein
MEVLSDSRKVPSVLIIDRFGATLNTDVSLHDNRKIAKARLPGPFEGVKI